MCVIAYVEKGRALNKEEFKVCFQNNPDGAGLMYQDKKKNLVHIQKGFMSFEEFWKVAKKLPINTERVFHFRIATSGEISKGICHPFPVCDDFNKMKRLDTYCKKGMVHNGILPEFEPKNGLKATYSDTMAFNKDVILPLGNSVFNRKVQDLIIKAYSCRYIVMSTDNIAVMGNWVQSKESGILYSNGTYQVYKYASYYTPHNNYDEYYYTDSYRDYVCVEIGEIETKSTLIDDIIDELWAQEIDVYQWELVGDELWLDVSPLNYPIYNLCGYNCDTSYNLAIANTMKEV